VKFDKYEHIGLCMILTSLASTLRAWFVVSGALVTIVLCLWLFILSCFISNAC